MQQIKITKSVLNKSKVQKNISSNFYSHALDAETNIAKKCSKANLKIKTKKWT